MTIIMARGGIVVVIYQCVTTFLPKAETTEPIGLDIFALSKREYAWKDEIMCSWKKQLC